jgi:DNA-binding XRE family transcriptional regulator
MPKIIKYKGFTLKRTGAFFSRDGCKIVKVPPWIPLDIQKEMIGVHSQDSILLPRIDKFLYSCLKKGVMGDFEEPLKIKDKLSIILKEARKAEGLTQLQLAEKAKVPRSAIARIEGNENRPVPTFKFFSKLMDALGYTTNISVIKGKKKFQTEIK